METPGFRTYEEVEQAVMQKVRERIIEGRFLTALLKGEFSEAQIREFALQYSYYSRNFPRILGAAIAAMEPIDKWWVPIADNLWDEAGRGNPKGYHSRLYRSFLESAAPDVKISDEHVPDYPVAPAPKQAVETFLHFLQTATPLEAMAAVGLGSELFAGEVMGLIGKGLRHPNYNQTRRLNVAFWVVHADDHEPRHYQLCKDILVQYQDPQDLQTMYRAGVTIAMSEADFYDGIYDSIV
ncbi:TenA family transcriptional regulator [Effusibacillus pohliae]|uniref:TenA family transcriptional regulator n=1 Tax=Effusibacillus pohliae TaxID=232270 RepID=UPI000368FA4E|nr:iron-containing redox enzyme family protein [Effusibacillus pohliae]